MARDVPSSVSADPISTDPTFIEPVYIGPSGQKRRLLPANRESSAFVKAEKTFYPASIRISHWQLRHYIANPEPHLLYFASDHNILCLNTETHKATHVAALPFSVRCFAAGHGFICAGGGDPSGPEAGEFAIVKLNPSWAAEVDAMLPLNLGSNSTPHKELTPDVKSIGKDIVNSVTIHKLKDPDPLVEDDIVAVVTSNDRMVRILSLTQGNIETHRLEMPFAVNHATISPNGEFLVAVGDYQQAYFYERTFSRSDRPRSLGGYASSCDLMGWDLLNIIMLHVLKPTIVSGYFTTAWSPSSRLCAVASECGYITVIEMERLKNLENGEDAIVTVFPGTRPEAQAGPGAIRTLMFSPAPWDLLAWAEDQGRVVVADLRDCCRSQQILKLDQEDGNVKKVMFKIPERLVRAKMLRTLSLREKVHNMEVQVEVSRMATRLSCLQNRQHALRRAIRMIINRSIRLNDHNDDAARIAREYESMQEYLDRYEQTTAERRRIEEQLADLRRESEQLGGATYRTSSNLDPRELQVLNSLRTTSDTGSRVGESTLRAAMREERARERESPSTRPRSIQYYRPSELGGRRSGLTRDDDFPALTRSRANVEPNGDEDDRLRILREFIRANPEPNTDEDDHMRIIRDFARGSANEEPETDEDRIRILRDFIRRPLINHPESESTIQSVHNLLYHNRREPALSLRATEIDRMLDQASAIDAARRAAGDPSRPSGAPSSSSSSSAAAPASRESSASARRRAQIERIHAFNRATVSAMRDANAPSARDAWSPQRYYTAVDTYIPASGAPSNTASGSSSTTTTTTATTTNAVPTPSSAAASTAGVRAAAAERASLARESLARQAQLEIRRQAVYLRRDVADPRDGVSTAGLAWSEDGGTLWVGCSEGIWEVDVNLKGRMGWSAMEFA